ncbi:hypothetical protein J7W08_09405 [Methanococcoides orientis]|uniref:DUF7714 family protein n=1 Tax=Methanococcoides orientis TaxID=2822137 RepID=UPI001E2FE4D4|nr:hypothetical protein [Methanococcoides orientis]UGV40289.1 hypothetical protein J7W08_09405 [Methanococcoides orientis]
MIFPDEYKYVGVTGIHPDDAEENIIYFLSEYMVVEDHVTEDEIEYSIYHVTKQGDDLLRDVEKLDLVASGEQVIKYDAKLNIKDRAQLIEIAAGLCKDDVSTVIFTGVDNHVTFVHEPSLSEIIDIEIVDVIPPEPSWLSHVVRRLEASGIFGDFGVRFTENVIDLSQFEGPKTVFPCSCSGLKGKFLDCDTITEDGTLLVGCEISKKLFETRFPDVEYSLVNICPFKSDIFEPTKPFITRCCRSEKSGRVTINGIEGVVVHWGASEFFVAEAVRDLALDLAEKRK